jgi:uncharacterized protein (DUF849 family)
MAKKKIIIEARINEYARRDPNRHIPYTVDEIVETAVRVREAGAAILHYHARTEDGGADTSIDTNAQIIRRVRAACDLLILPTLGFIANDKEAGDRIDTVVALSQDPLTRPDIAPIDTGSANLETWDAHAHRFEHADRLYVNTTESLIHYASELKRVGVKPKLVSWSVGFTRRALAMMEAGYVSQPGYFLFHLTDGAILTGHPATQAGLAAHLSFLPKNLDVEWTVNCLGGNLLELAPMIAREGGHMAIGIGDYPYPELGLPDNAVVVREAVKLARAEQREPATPQDARELLGLG